MVGSIDSHRTRANASPGPGAGAAPTSWRTTLSSTMPRGRAARSSRRFSRLTGTSLGHSLGPLLELLHGLERIGPDGGHVEDGGPRLAECGDALLDVPGRADEVRLLEQLGGHGGSSFVLLARQVQLLDLVRLLLVAVAARQGVVEVPSLGPHAADVERGHGPSQVEHPLEPVADGDEAAP